MTFRGKCQMWLRASLHSASFAGLILIAACWFVVAFVSSIEHEKAIEGALKHTEGLVRLFEQQGGEDSGFLVDVGAKTMTVVDYRLKRRSDLAVVAPELRELIGGQIVRRLLPAVERYFQFQATRMDRYIVACYDNEIGGHFYRHRDNVNAGAQHRRFAITINLNSDYDGCDLVFPEFGRKTYRAPHGGALVFSCGALHQVTPITRGRRYASRGRWSASARGRGTP